MLLRDMARALAMLQVGDVYLRLKASFVVANL